MGNAKNKDALATDLRGQAENFLKRKEPDPGFSQVNGETLRLLHELQVHQIELEMQNDELLQARDEMEIVLEKYTDLYDFAPVAYLTLDHVGTILAANLAAARLFAIERFRLPGRRLGLFVVKEHQQLFSGFLGKVFASQGKESCEVMLTPKKCESPLYVLIEAIILGTRQECRVVIIDITGRKQAEELLKAALAEKEAMLKEIHHRVKNNLQVISSLVSLQIDNLTDERMRAVLGDMRDRVRSMALIHEALYQTNDLAQLNFAEYATSVLHALWSSNGTLAEKARLKLALTPVMLSIETAVPCGLILNELASNALKHAFPNKSCGEVTVSLEHDPSVGTVCLRVSDNGISMPVNLDWRQSKSLGLRLVQILTGQLHGTVEAGTGPGTEFRVTFPLKGLSA